MEGDEAGILVAGIDRDMMKPLRKSAIAEVIAVCCPPDAAPVVRLAAALADAARMDVAPMDAT